MPTNIWVGISSRQLSKNQSIEEPMKNAIKLDMIAEAQSRHMDKIHPCNGSKTWDGCFTEDTLGNVPYLFFWYNVSIKGIPKGTLTTRILKRRI
jgi:hypothetical protein